MNAGAPPPLTRALLDGLSRYRDVVLQAPTGAGKSTIVPLALLAQLPPGQKILMLEPRRLAARAVATRMASQLGERVGERIGWRMRLDTRVSAATRIEVVTEGVLTRMLQDDPALDGVAYLIFDEYHERSLAADLGLALALDARRQLDAAFRLLIMSATIEGERVASMLGDAGVITVAGRAFPVQTVYLGRGLPRLPEFGSHATAEQAAALAVARALAESDGDVLVFLPGLGEIRRLETLLRSASLPPQVRIRPLYGEMSSAAQDAVLAPAQPGQRNVVLATNIAETSLTIPAVTAVVDVGLVRRARFDAGTGMSRLDLVRISRAASDQRAGRAGRVAPGICYRLWSEGAQQSLAAATPAEILEADLAGLALELARWGVDDAGKLDWLDAPPAATLQQARELLLRLGALDERQRLTELGRQMSALPVHPRLAHMLLAAPRLQALPLAAQLAALLSERDVLRNAAPGSARDPDIRTRLEALGGAGSGPGADRGVLERVRRSAQALQAAVRVHAVGVDACIALDASEHAGALLALAFPDRIGQRREGTEARYLLANGRGAAFAGASSLARAEFIVAVVLDDREREARIDLAIALSRFALERLFAGQIITQEVFGWDARAAAVVARRVRRLQALVIEERAMPTPDGAAVRAAMLEGVRQCGLACLPWNPQARTLQARLQFVGSLRRADLGTWPACDEAGLLADLPQWLGPHLHDCTRLEHLQRLPLAQALRDRLTPAQQRALDTLAPRELRVPTGSCIAIDYLDDNAPCVAVRLQELFGLTQTPRIGGDSVALTFKLLSPAQRPLQITRDLAGFWRSSYFEVRKEMRGRYPKHDWPEDPLQAPASRGSRRRGGSR